MARQPRLPMVGPGGRATLEMNPPNHQQLSLSAVLPEI
jgi:hypothetical protein